MKIFNGVIDSTNDILENHSYQAWDYNESQAWRDAGRNELIMVRDTAFELGGSGLPASHYTCITGDESYVSKDEVLLYGPDLDAIAKDSPYTRIAIITADVLDADDEDKYHSIRDIEFQKYHVFPEGYMMRISSSRREEVRISKKAVKRGISFKSVGFDFIRKYKESPNVKNVKVIFITEPSMDYKALTKLTEKNEEIAKTLTRIFDGFASDCSSCDMKPICDEVEGMREMHLGQGK